MAQPTPGLKTSALQNQRETGFHCFKAVSTVLSQFPVSGSLYGSPRTLIRRLKNSKQTAQPGRRWPQCALTQLCVLQELPVLGERDLPGLLPQAWALPLRRVMDKWGSPVRGQESPSGGAQEVHSVE